MHFDSEELVKSLSEKDLLSVYDNGKTALHLAANRPSSNVLGILLEKVGSRIINVTDDDGNTALMTSCKWNNEQVSVRKITKFVS